ncbi:hypothetical protein ACAS46_002072 [Vibrio vulnificus]
MFPNHSVYLFKFEKFVFSLLVISTVLRFDSIFDGANRFIPYRVTILSIIAVILFSYIFNNEFKVKLTSLKYCVLLLLVVLVFNFFWVHRHDEFVVFVNGLLSFLYIIGGAYLIIRLSSYLDSCYLFKFRVIFLSISIIIFSIEAYIRFFHPDLGLNSNMDVDIIKERMSQGISNDNFFYFKYGSIMFFDSNYIGLNLLPLIILTLVHHKYRKIFLFFLCFLVFLSLSRSAILGMASIFFLWLTYLNRRSLVFIYFLLCFLAPFIFYFVYDFVKDDASFITKVAIFKSLYVAGDVTFLELLFGFGLDKGPFIYSPNDDAYAHALVPLLLGQVGILGCAIYFITWFCLISRYGFPMFLTFFVLNLCGLSLADPWEVTYFYISIFSSVIFRRKKVY